MMIKGKKIMSWVILAAFLSLNLTSAAYAQSVPGPSGPATAEVGEFLEFAFSKVYKMSVAEGDSDPFTDGTELLSPDFNFGQLSEVTDIDDKFLYMQGEFFYFVMMIATTSGRRYKITETGTAMTGPGGATLPTNSVLLIPDYQWKDQLVVGVDQGAPPGSAFVGSATTASGTESLVYQSDDAGLSRMVRGAISIAGPPAGGATKPQNYSLGHNGPDGQGSLQEFGAWEPVTQDQPAGSYDGTITFTLTLD